MTAPPAGALEACPFCGHEPQDLRDAFHPSGIRWREDHGQRHYIGAKDPRDGTPCWELSCLEHEGGCGASMSGDGRDEVLAKWNRRTHGPALLAALWLREWRPIESAPKDGARVLLGNAAGAWIGEYRPVYRSGYRPPDPWSSSMLNHDHIPRDGRWKSPTHWMPLPAPPTADDLARVLENER